MTGGPFFEDVTEGDAFDGAMTVTESHVVTAAGLFGDFASLHMNEEFARQTRFKARIAHGTLITGIMAGVLSGHFDGTAIGYIDQTVRFKAPVYLGDTVVSRWRVTQKASRASTKLGGGVVRLDVECSARGGEVVLEGDASLIVKSRELTLVTPAAGGR